MLKAKAELHGWDHTYEREFHHIASRLRVQNDDRDIYRPFAVATVLHENFYENQMATQDIERALDDVERLIDKLKMILTTCTTRKHDAPNEAERKVTRLSRYFAARHPPEQPARKRPDSPVSPQAPNYQPAHPSSCLKQTGLRQR